MRPALVVLALALGACGGAGSPPPPDPGPDGCALAAEGAPWLAFASRRTGDYEIWRARADGTCLAQISHDPAVDLFPTWSGTTVVYASERGGALRLWAHALATGTEAALEMGDLVAATAPAFSPDGAWLAFEGRAPGATTSDVWLVPAGGGTPVALAPHAADDGGPAWSPDGQTVYFVSLRSGRYDVWSVPVAGGAPVAVTTSSRIVGKPAPSADGAALVYARTVSGASTTEVVRRDLATGEVTVLTSQDDSEPAISPDGARLAVRSFRDGHADIVVAAPDGSGAVLLTSDAASDGVPAFARAP